MNFEEFRKRLKEKETIYQAASAEAQEKRNDLANYVKENLGVDIRGEITLDGVLNIVDKVTEMKSRF